MGKKMKVKMLAALAAAVCVAQAAEYVDIDPLTTRWTFGAHEPYTMYRRVGKHCTGGIDGNAQWVKQWLDWWDEHAPEKMEELGLNFLHSRFYKGMGWEVEKKDFPNVRKFVRNCHGHGVKALAYVQFNTLYPEAMRAEIPDIDSWASIDYMGRKNLYGGYNGQYFRWAPCLTCREWEEYLKRMCTIALVDGEFDGIMFDNVFDMPCYCDRCQKAFRAYLAKIENPAERFGFDDLSHMLLPRLDMSRLSSMEVKDPVLQSWALWRCCQMNGVLTRLRAHIKSVKPGAIVSGNPSPYRARTRFLSAAQNMAELCKAFDFIIMQCANFPEVKPKGVIVNRVRDLKYAQDMGQRIVALCDTDTKIIPEREENFMLPLVEDVVFGGIPTDRTIIAPSPEPGFVNAEVFARRKVQHRMFNDFVSAHRDALGSPTVHSVRIFYPEREILFSEATHQGVTAAEEIFLRNRVPYGYLVSSPDDVFTVPEGTEVIVVPGLVSLSDAEIAALVGWAKKGGRLVVTGDSGRYDDWNAQRRVNTFLPQLEGLPNVSVRATADLIPGARLAWGYSVPPPADGGKALMDDLAKTGWKAPVRLEGLPPCVFAEYRRMPDGRLAVHLVNYDAKHPVRNARILLDAGASATFEEPFGGNPAPRTVPADGALPAFTRYALLTVRGTMPPSAPAFQTALPVWPEGRATRMNDFVEFRASFDAKAGEKPVLRVTGSSVYRIRLNGEFAGYGPARAAKGFFRVDEWPLAAREGRNDLAIEVSAYNCNNYYIAEWPGFLQAEVVADGRVLAATGRDFGACETPRVTKCSRYSFQRAFGEAYRLALGWKGEPLTLGVQPSVPLVERIAPLPDFPVTMLGAPIISTKVRRKDQIKYRPIRSVDSHEPTFKLYEVNSLDVNIWKELQHVEVLQSVARLGNAAVAGRPPYQMADGNGLVFDVGFNETGFPGLTVSCTKPGRLWMAFDEILQDGKVNPLRYGVANGVVWDLQPGRYRVEAFEPYTFRYLHVFALGGEFQIEGPYVRGYKNPDAKKASFTSSDPALDKIFAAARETFAQNAVDVFTDCPSRERAGWLCDSFFTGRSNLLFTGNTDLERLFIQNYLLPKSFPELPDGVLPMCYPSDHPNHKFIPNWTMWLVIEIDEYLRRSGDRATVDAMKPRLVKLINYLKAFRNSDGLLEKLPAWVFVEWSEANRLVQDVNYPSNMTWAEVLDCMDRLYGMPELAAEAKQVRETVRKQSWTGRWFCDNAVRQKDGTLKLSGKCTETCQYYAFMFKTATPELYPELWKTLLADFGPKRKETKKHPEIYFANAFIGNYLRLELLSRAGLGRQLLDETKGYFSLMAERTGTLWENDTPHASCNHGFASHAAVFYVKNVLGISAINARAKTVKATATDVPLEYCSATLPVPGGAVTYGWTKKGGKADETFTAPPGWRLVR